MNYNFSNFKERVGEIEKWLLDELSSLRTGRAVISILDNVKVEAYGSKMPINQVASISLEDARTIRISPYDKTQIKGIEKSIVDSNLGLSVNSGNEGLRVIFPELTSERRESLIKVLKEKLEEAKISLRRKREEIWENIQEKEKKGEMTEDDKFKSKEDMQKLVDEAQKKFEDIAKKKEDEIRV